MVEDICEELANIASSSSGGVDVTSGVIAGPASSDPSGGGVAAVPLVAANADPTDGAAGRALHKGTLASSSKRA